MDAELSTLIKAVTPIVIALLANFFEQRRGTQEQKRTTEEIRALRIDLAGLRQEAHDERTAQTAQNLRADRRINAIEHHLNLETTSS